MMASISKQIPDNIKRVARSVGYALWLDNAEDWFGLPLILRARLDASQRAALAYMALKSLDHDDAVVTADKALNEQPADQGEDLPLESAGPPLPPVFDAMDEAVFWADMATPDERDAYCLATFNRLAPHRQAEFLEFLQRRAVA